MHDRIGAMDRHRALDFIGNREISRHPDRGVRYRGAMPLRQIVKDHHLMIMSKQYFGGHTANVARTPSHHHSHRASSTRGPI